MKNTVARLGSFGWSTDYNMRRAWLPTIYISGDVARNRDDQPKIIYSSSFAMCLIMIFGTELGDNR
jgi:hypothetical protein